MENLVVVGASLAGLRAAQGARAAGHVGPITVIGEEPHLPYNRPPLSKQLLAGEQVHADCAFPMLGLDADFRLGVPATRLDTRAHDVVLADGTHVAYDRVVVATGCRARAWAGSGGRLEGVLTLRSIDDAHALRSALSGRPRLAVVGAGFIGCEVAATAHKLGCPVTLVDVAPHPLPPLGAELGARCAQLHRDHGVVLRLGVGVAGLIGTTRVEGVALDDGTQVAADLVVVGLGGVPNTEWLGAAVPCDDRGGVVCDTTLTSVADPDVLAAGDVAAWPHPLAGGERVRVEHWTTAAEHGTLAGRNAPRDAGEREAHTAPPYFWSDQYSVKIQAVGFPGRAARLHVVEDDGDRVLAEAHDGAGRLIGAIAFNHAKRLSDYRRLLVEEAVPA